MTNNDFDQPFPYSKSEREWKDRMKRRGEDIYGYGEEREDRNPYSRSFHDPDIQPGVQYALDESTRRMYYGNYQDYVRSRGYPGRDARLMHGIGSEDPPYRTSHRGKGPRSYKRLDERILEDISQGLSDAPMVDATNIDVTVNEGEVVLTGTVDDRYMKPLAEDIAEAVPGVVNVENRIRVNKPR